MAEPQAAITIRNDGTIQQHGAHSLDEAAQNHWSRVEDNAIARTIERLADKGLLKVSREDAAKALGVDLY